MKTQINSLNALNNPPEARCSCARFCKVTMLALSALLLVATVALLIRHSRSLTPEMEKLIGGVGVAGLVTLAIGLCIRTPQNAAKQELPYGPVLPYDPSPKNNNPPPTNPDFDGEILDEHLKKLQTSTEEYQNLANNNVVVVESYYCGDPTAPTQEN